MAEIQIAIIFDAEDDGDALGRVLDRLSEACPLGADFGLMVDGVHRDPDSPGETLF